MMKSYIFYSFVACVSFVSCNPGVSFQEVDIFQEFPEPIFLAPDKEYHLSLDHPMDYLVIDSLLFTIELTQDRFVRCTNLNTEREVSFFLSKGRGPGELINGLAMRYISDSIQVYGDHLTILQFAIRDVLNGIKVSDYRTYQMKGDFLVRNHAFKFNETTALFHGTLASQEDEHRFCLYDFSTDAYRTFGDYNPDFFKNMDLGRTGKNLINQVCIQFHPDMDRFVAVTSNFKSIEIYDLNSTEMIASRYYELPKADIQKSGYFTFTFASEEQKGFSVYCTKQAIYCFYAERKPIEGEANRSLYIFVFDWQLNPLTCYAMPAASPNCFVTADDCFIYTSIIDSKTGEYVFCRYETGLTF